MRPGNFPARWSVCVVLWFHLVAPVYVIWAWRNQLGGLRQASTLNSTNLKEDAADNGVASCGRLATG